MLKTLLRRLGIAKKLIVLSFPAYYPAWHSRYGEKTLQATCLISGRHYKIHVFKRDIEMWQQIARKFSTGRYELHICYQLSESGPKKYIYIMRGDYLHIQVARFLDEDTGHLLIEGKVVPMDKVALNEGISKADLLEWKKHLDKKDFCIVHFTEFKY